MTTLAVAHSPTVPHKYHGKNPGCRTPACDRRVGRRWWQRHHPDPAPSYEPGLASWFDDSGGTACGTHFSRGVAHKELPCGTRLRICYSRCETAYVEDRGPFIAG